MEYCWLLSCGIVPLLSAQRTNASADLNTFRDDVQIAACRRLGTRRIGLSEEAAASDPDQNLTEVLFNAHIR